jgi:predicted Holliday junction resolvase-like endonuclease
MGYYLMIFLPLTFTFIFILFLILIISIFTIITIIVCIYNKQKQKKYILKNKELTEKLFMINDLQKIQFSSIKLDKEKKWINKNHWKRSIINCIFRNL